MKERGMAMASGVINVKMLGGFSIEWDGHEVDDHSNRMRKVWLLLAYLIYNRNGQISQNHYISLLNGKNGKEAADAAGNLKAMFYRARAMLDQLESISGHDLILRKAGSYAWNTEIPLRLDVEEFEALCREAADSEDEMLRLERYKQALELYAGDFLPKLAMEPWVMPLTAYYHRIYLETVEKVLDTLEQSSKWSEAADLCEKALKVEPYSEALYQHLMRCKIAMEDRAAALSIYDEMSKLLFESFSVMPSEESRVIYREASRAVESVCIPVGTIRDRLREPDATKGALFCEYDFFKMLYQVQARAIARSGETIHFAVFSLCGQYGKEISKRSLYYAVTNLKEQIVNSLRQGDVVTQCSATQLIVMLPQANYENSCAVCDRLVRNFKRQYPHSPVDIQVSVQPLEPFDLSAEQVKEED